MGVKHVTKNDFDKEITDPKLPVLVDFWLPGADPAECWPRFLKNWTER
jgi:thioredoxin-like negative regulator of GroEL